MANFNLTGSFYHNVDLGYISSLSPATLTVAPGDTITMQTSALNTQTISVSYPSTLFTDSSTGFTLSGAADSVVKTVASNTGGFSILYDPPPLYTNKTCSVTVAVDDTPDAFVFTDVTGANTSTEYISNPITISGLGTSVAVSITANGATYSKNSGAWTSAAGTAVNGDTFQIKVTSSSSLSTAVHTSLFVGTGSDTYTVTTAAAPPVTLEIPFPKTIVPVSIGDIKGFFGGPGNLQSYLRAGIYVPDIAANSGVPSILPISVQDLLGSSTTYFVSTHPDSKGTGGVTTSGPIVRSLTWTLGVDWDIGFGGAASNSELRYTIAYDVQDVTPVITPSGYATYSSSNTFITLTATSGNNVEQICRGTITFYARHTSDNTKILTTTADFNFLFFGP